MIALKGVRYCDRTLHSSRNQKKTLHINEKWNYFFSSFVASCGNWELELFGAAQDHLIQLANELLEPLRPNRQDSAAIARDHSSLYFVGPQAYFVCHYKFV